MRIIDRIERNYQRIIDEAAGEKPETDDAAEEEETDDETAKETPAQPK